MFKVNFLVRDQKLAGVLKTLSGAVLNLEVNPVVTPRPKARVATKRRGAFKDGVTEIIAAMPDRFTAGEVLKQAKTRGIARGTVYQTMSAGVSNGTLERLGQGEYRRVGA